MTSKEDTVPLKPISSNDVGWEEHAAGPRFGVRRRDLTRAVGGGACRIRVAIEELDPGRQNAPAQYHMLEEQHVYVLDGTLTVRLGGEAYTMRPGDYACFPAGQRLGHCLLNNGDGACRYVRMAERNPNEVIVHSDSGKALVRALGAILDLTARRGYWDGEDTGAPKDGAPPFDRAGDGAPAPGKPHPPVSSREVALEEMREGTRFGGGTRHLTYAAVGAHYHVGVLIEAPAPGLRLAPLHYHMEEEEHALILEGQVVLLRGEERPEMKPGDYACFPAGRKIGHSFMNGGTGPCSYLMIGERRESDVCVYPHSNKMAVSTLRIRDAVFDMGAKKDYWDGE